MPPHRTEEATSVLPWPEPGWQKYSRQWFLKRFSFTVQEFRNVSAFGDATELVHKSVTKKVRTQCSPDVNRILSTH